jgi:hypothetical protein
MTMLVFVEITLTSQSREAMDRFERGGRFDDILECHLMSGSADYLPRVAAADLAQYDRIHRDCLARLPGVSAMRSSFSLRQIKRLRAIRFRTADAGGGDALRPRFLRPLSTSTSELPGSFIPCSSRNCSLNASIAASSGKCATG